MSDWLAEIKADLQTGRDLSTAQQRQLVEEVERLRLDVAPQRNQRLSKHRRFHGRHLTGFHNMTRRARIYHLQQEHDLQTDGLDVEGMGRAHDRLHG